MSKKIIVAEDSSVIQNLIKRILTQKGYEITSVKNGAKVLEKLSESQYDLILMDIHMPIMNGMECAKSIRELEDDTKAKTPIIAITGNANNYDENDFQNAGIGGFIPKPINYDLLLETVNQTLS